MDQKSDLVKNQGQEPLAKILEGNSLNLFGICFKTSKMFKVRDAQILSSKYILDCSRPRFFYLFLFQTPPPQTFNLRQARLKQRCFLYVGLLYTSEEDVNTFPIQ